MKVMNLCNLLLTLNYWLEQNLDRITKAKKVHTQEVYRRLPFNDNKIFHISRLALMTGYSQV